MDFVFKQVKNRKNNCSLKAQIKSERTSFYINLLLAECEVRTVSYGPSFFLPFMAQARSARAMKTRKEKTRIHNLPYGPSKRGQYDVYYMALLIIPVLKR